MALASRSARLMRELESFQAEPPWGITCNPDEQASFETLQVSLLGPRGSPYEGGTFKLAIFVPESYPFEPPMLKFKTQVYHPNIDKAGRVCMDLLKMPPKGAWLPTITLETLLVSLQTLMACPNPDDPLMVDIANEYKYDIELFNMNARRFTRLYATP